MDVFTAIKERRSCRNFSPDPVSEETIEKILEAGIWAPSPLNSLRGPSMSAVPGKVEVQGVTELRGEKVFVLRFIQGRNPEWVQRPFFAKYDPKATWLDQLRPAFGDEKFFFEDYSFNRSV